MDRRIQSLYWIGRIHQLHLNQPAEAHRRYQEIVDRFGLAHHLGRATFAALRELKKDLVLPPKAALVWGGRDTTQNAWDAVLGPMGFKTHVVAQYAVSEAHLAPYSLVVLARSGLTPYSPDDILALRSYVATGGSLLVIVSPGWDPSQPGNQNSLLWLFGVQADQGMEIRAKNTRIAPHAVTKGVSSVVANNAVNLTAPQGTGLIQAGDRTVLAAFPYRHGRVVVASLGQWFLPGLSDDPDVSHSRWSQIPRGNLPFATGPQRQLPLLVNVVRWLTEPRPDEEELRNRRKPFVEALAASMRVQLGIDPRDALKDALKKLVAEAEAGVWKEEALWTAGEASLRWVYGDEKDALGNPKYGFSPAEGPPQPVLEYYERLNAEFPQSPLRPLAQWRLAECLRRKAIADRFKVSRHINFSDGAESIPAFEKVDSPKGTYPWAWARLWIGNIHGYNRRYKEAATPFREVAETMPTSPEKSMALLNLGRMLTYDKATLDEAARYCQAARDAPDNAWWACYYNAWGPVQMGRGEWTLQLHDLADAWLEDIRLLKSGRPMRMSESWDEQVGDP
jgi:tetratricopeptide (TPR) repeat protein